MLKRTAAVMTMATLVACSSSRQASPPRGSPEPIRLFYVPVSDEIFVDIAIAAAGWSKGTAGASLGVYQPTGESPRFQRAVEAMTQRFALRPIPPSEYQVVCGTDSRQPTSVSRTSSSCSMKHVKTVMLLGSMRMTRDSASVAIGLTRVPTGTNRPETVQHCVVLARKGPGWEVRRSERTQDQMRCPRGWA